MNISNPYRPGAGLMPLVLAGRDEIIDKASNCFESLNHGIPVQSMAYTGFRGVGKTVLLNRLLEIAQSEYGIACYHIEVAKAGTFVAKINNSCRKYLIENSSSEKIKTLFDKALSALRALELSYNPTDSSISLSMNERLLYSNMDLSMGLQDLLTAIGEIAKKKNSAICFFIDEFQYTSQEEMDGFISALHRANQLSLPIMAFCAGTPDMIKMLHREKTYVERLFLFPKLDLLTHEDVKEAIELTGNTANLKYTDEALDRIADITEGYPFFVQQFGQVIFEKYSGDNNIDLKMVNDTIPEYYKILDDNFYMSRYEDRGNLEKQCMNAMSTSPTLPCSASYIAKQLDKNIKQISPTLSRLRNKGIISYETFGAIDFTAPGFADFINRNYIS